MPLWVGDGGGIGNALLFFLLMRTLPERRGFTVAVRRRGALPPRIDAFECHRSVDVANARAAELDSEVRAGGLDENRALSRAERRAAVARAAKPGH